MHTELSKGTEREGSVISLSMKMKIITCQMEKCQKDPGYLKELLTSGTPGIIDMDDRDLFRLAMMHGLLDEDAGMER
jgi:hypothetical protein